MALKSKILFNVSRYSNVSNLCLYLNVFHDVEICNLYDCKNNGSCTNDNGQPKCNCTLGYTGEYCESCEKMICFLVLT